MEDIKTKIEETKKELARLENIAKKEACKAEVIDITERIKSYEEACEVLGETPKDFTNDSLDEIAYKKLKTIVKALNQDWEPNWSDVNERKWYPYFNMAGSVGFSLLGMYFEYWDSYSCVGSRFVFQNEKTARYAGDQFLDLYRDVMKLS